MIVLLKSSGFKPMVKCCDRLVFWLGLDVISRAHQSWGGGGGGLDCFGSIYCQIYLL